ncbi:MAG TPA: hypothetical protein VHH73_01930 [Verrucomicrobiae bacterium]|nr:hypothetical protein [Verrucomicrobiae bacterium]
MWAAGWVDWSAAPANTNTAYLTQEKYSVVAAYLEHRASVFKCPADIYLSPIQQRLGWKGRIRSYSQVMGVGDGNAVQGLLPPIYGQAKKISDLIIPGPAETFVYLDEHADSINDAAFFPPPSGSWSDLPAAYHNGADGFGFADGHAEMHRWSQSLAGPATAKVRYNFTLVAAKTGDRDLHWFSYHSVRLSEKSY